jgi:hypothetical protein
MAKECVRRLTVKADGNVYYFAYGSNMSARYLYNVRGVFPQQSEAGSLEGHEVRFLAPGLNALEPAFAYMVPAHSGVAHGVVHLIQRISSLGS